MRIGLCSRRRKTKRIKFLLVQRWALELVGEQFTPDPRTNRWQRFCSKATCKLASKAWRQKLGAQSQQTGIIGEGQIK